MFKFIDNIMNYNSVTPRLKLPFNIVKGSLQQRNQKAMEYVEKFYADILPKYKKGVLQFDEVQKSIDKIFEHKIHVKAIKSHDSTTTGGQDILSSEYNGKISSITLEMDNVKNDKLSIADLITLLHEFQHVVDQLFHPKFLARYQYMASGNLYTNKYDKLYDNFLYTDYAPLGRKEKIKVLKQIKHKILHFFRGLTVEEKINYIQDARYFLISEDNAYKTQYKYAKKMSKKHFPISDDDKERQNGAFMFKEKIDLLTKLGFEIIQKERKKFARMPKNTKCEDM